MARLVALGLLVVAACSDSVDDDGAHSGSRLKIVDWVFDDGTRQWKGFHDAKLEQDCQALVWDDGTYYCTPGTLVQYADPGCTQPIIVGTSALGYERPFTPCGNTTTHVFEVGNQLTLPRYYYAQDAMGRCLSQTPDQTQTLFSVGAEVPRSELVELAVTAPSGTGRVQTRYLTSSDGMQFPWLLHDQQLGLDCTATGFDGQQSVSCSPAAAEAKYSRDSACSVPVAAVDLGCPSPSVAMQPSTSACPTEQYFSVDPTPVISPLFEMTGSTCSTAAPAAATN